MLSGFLKKLLFARQFMIDEGKIEVLGRRQIMLPSDLFLALQSINEKAVYSAVKDHIQENMCYYAKRIGTTSQGMLKSSEDIFETFGLGKIQVVKLDNSKKNAVIRVNNHPFSNCKLNGHVCTLHSAALAGMFSFLFSKDVDCKATSCACNNNGFCEFIIK